MLILLKGELNVDIIRKENNRLIENRFDEFYLYLSHHKITYVKY